MSRAPARVDLKNVPAVESIAWDRHRAAPDVVTDVEVNEVLDKMLDGLYRYGWTQRMLSTSFPGFSRWYPGHMCTRGLLNWAIFGDPRGTRMPDEGDHGYWVYHRTEQRLGDSIVDLHPDSCRQLEAFNDAWHRSRRSVFAVIEHARW